MVGVAGGAGAGFDEVVGKFNGAVEAAAEAGDVGVGGGAGGREIGFTGFDPAADVIGGGKAVNETAEVGKLFGTVGGGVVG